MVTRTAQTIGRRPALRGDSAEARIVSSRRSATHHQRKPLRTRRLQPASLSTPEPRALAAPVYGLRSGLLRVLVSGWANSSTISSAGGDHTPIDWDGSVEACQNGARAL